MTSKSRNMANRLGEYTTFFQDSGISKKNLEDFNPPGFSPNNFKRTLRAGQLKSAHTAHAVIMSARHPSF
jgi:hypothetical protein